MSAEEIYQAFVKQANPAKLLTMERTDLATQLMIDRNLEETAAFYVADQILAVAQEIHTTD